MLKLTTAVAAVLLLASSAQAATPAQQLASFLKPALTAKYAGHVFTKVYCKIPSMTATKATCIAAFTQSSAELKGNFHVAITINRSTGGVTWKATSVTCADLKTGKPVKC